MMSFILDFERLIQVCDVDGCKGIKTIKECRGTVYSSVLIVGRVFKKEAAGNESGQIDMTHCVCSSKELGLTLKVDGNH